MIVRGFINSSEQGVNDRGSGPSLHVRGFGWKSRSEMMQIFARTSPLASKSYIVQARGEATDNLKPPISWFSIAFSHKAAPKAGFKLMPWPVQSKRNCNRDLQLLNPPYRKLAFLLSDIK